MNRQVLRPPSKTWSRFSRRISRLQTAKCGSTNRFSRSRPDVSPVQLNLRQSEASYFIRWNPWMPLRFLLRDNHVRRNLGEEVALFHVPRAAECAFFSPVTPSSGATRMQKPKKRHVPPSATPPRPGEIARAKGRALSSGFALFVGITHVCVDA